MDKNDKKTWKRTEYVGKIINEGALNRLKDLIQTSQGEVLLGGIEGIDQKNEYIAPTIILNPSENSKLMQEEIFGPILPVLTYKKFDEVIERIQRG